MQKTGREKARRHAGVLGIPTDDLRPGDPPGSECCVRDPSAGKNALRSCPRGTAVLPPCSLPSRPRPGPDGETCTPVLVRGRILKDLVKSLSATASGTGGWCWPHCAEGKREGLSGPGRGAGATERGKAKVFS